MRTGSDEHELMSERVNEERGGTRSTERGMMSGTVISFSFFLNCVLLKNPAIGDHFRFPRLGTMSTICVHIVKTILYDL